MTNKNKDIREFLKIRASYGEVGNDKVGGARFLYRPSSWIYVVSARKLITIRHLARYVRKFC